MIEHKLRDKIIDSPYAQIGALKSVILRQKTLRIALSLCTS